MWNTGFANNDYSYDVAQTPEQLIAMLDLLKVGMDLGEVFELLDFKRTTPGVREIVNAEVYEGG